MRFACRTPCASGWGGVGLELEPTKIKLVEFGRFAERHADKRGRRRPETIYFLGFALYCTQNQQGDFKVGLRTEKSRLQRALSRLRDLMRRMGHLPVREQVINLNRVLRRLGRGGAIPLRYSPI